MRDRIAEFRLLIADFEINHKSQFKNPKIQKSKKKRRVSCGGAHGTRRLNFPNVYQERNR
jgi:hypothetical protein